MRPVNRVGIELIKSFESFRADPYQDEGGVWTIGYGHVSGVTQDTASITLQQAETFLLEDMSIAKEGVERSITVQLSDNQYAALVSLVFNTGSAPLARMLGTKLNAGDYAGAAQEFLRWRLSGGIVSDGLLRRRQAERALFLLPDDTSNT